MKEKRTFLFLYEFLKMGGIEKNLIYMIKSYSAMGIRIIWIRYGNPEDIYEPWKDVLNACQVEIVNANIQFPVWFTHDKVNFSKEEKITALCFEPTDFVRLEELAAEYENQFDLFYMVPHFEGDRNYVEKYYFSNIQRKRTVKKLCKVYKNWFENGNLLFFDKRHWSEMNARYKIGGDKTYEDLIYKSPVSIRPFDSNLIIKKYHRHDFRIITCGRFEFPHKGYMFGLIDDYVVLKNKYPNIMLDIIGYGDEKNERKIRSYVAALDSKYSDDIHFIGAVDPEKINEYFDNANLNISVAGGLIDGAKAGVVSIPARHYTYNCEVYGMLDGDLSIVLSNEPGMDAKPFIEKIINMTGSEYLNACEKSYSTVSATSSDKEWMFNRKNASSNYYSESDIYLFKKIYDYRKMKYRMKCIIKKILKPILIKINVYDYCVNKWRKMKDR